MPKSQIDESVLCIISDVIVAVEIIPQGTQPARRQVHKTAHSR